MAHVTNAYRVMQQLITLLEGECDLDRCGIMLIVFNPTNGEVDVLSSGPTRNLTVQQKLHILYQALDTIKYPDQAEDLEEPHEN